MAATDPHVARSRPSQNLRLVAATRAVRLATAKTSLPAGARGARARKTPPLRVVPLLHAERQLPQPYRPDHRADTGLSRADPIGAAYATLGSQRRTSEGFA